MFLRNKIIKKNYVCYRIIQATKYIITSKFYRAKYILGVYFNFKKAQKNFSLVHDNKKIDCMIYGSDTIWNINDPYFQNNWKRFWGGDFDGKKITYAISIGSTSPENIQKKDFLCDALQEFQYVFVRDKATYDFVKSNLKSNAEVDLVVDPTMLLSVDEYEKIAPQCPDEKYILFYYFCGVPESLRKQARDFANKTERKIICFGEKNDWADKCITHDPFKMLSYYKNADYIITNTFHGNVFSLIFNKQFVSLGKEKQKVKDLLNVFGLDNRLIDENDALETVLSSEINFDEVNSKLNLLREKSLSKLKRAIFYEVS